jgi:hypothetical protein
MLDEAVVLELERRRVPIEVIVVERIAPGRQAARTREMEVVVRSSTLQESGLGLQE